MNTIAETPALEDLVISTPRPTDPRISPDGRWVAYVAKPYGQSGDHPESTIWLVPVGGRGKAEQFTSGPGEDTHPRWSPDGQSIAFLSDRVERGTRALYLLPITGGEAQILHKRKRSIESFEWSPSGRVIAFIAADEPTQEDERRKAERDDADVYGKDWNFARLYVYEFETENVQQLSTGDMHVTDLSWHPSSAHIAFLASPTPELETTSQSRIYTIDVNGNEATEVGNARGWLPGDLCWTGDGSTLVYRGTHDDVPQSASTIIAVDITTGDARTLTPSIDDEACAAGVHSVGEGNRLVISIAQGLSTRLDLMDLDSGDRQSIYRPEQGDILPTVDIVTPGPREPLVALIQSSGAEPPELYAGRVGSMRRLTDHHAGFRAWEFGTQEPFNWTAPDGLDMDGVLIRPPATGDGPLPTVVLVHGGPYGRYAEQWNLAPLLWGQWLAVHGLATLMPNYRGGMGRGNAFAASARGNVGVGDFPDIMSAVDTAVDRGIADPNRLGIGGWSQGGFMTAWAVTQTNRFKAGVMGAGVSDWGMMAMASDVPTFEGILGGDRPWDSPGPHKAARNSPISYAKDAETPLLILHGQEDVRVPVTQAIGFERALRENGTTVQLVTYPREPHGIRESNHQRDVLRRVRDWYLQWL